MHFYEDENENMKDKIKSVLENDVKISHNIMLYIVVYKQYYFISDYLQLISVMIEYKINRYYNLPRKGGKP